MSSGTSSSGYSLDKIPVQQPPAGQTSNFVNPPSLGPEVITVDAVFTSIMLVIVMLRTFVRWKWVQVWELSDYWIGGTHGYGYFRYTSHFEAGLSRNTDLSFFFFCSGIKEAGYGRHMWDVPVSWVLNNRNVRLMSSNGIIFPITIFFAKASILLLYLRIFGVNRWLRTTIYIGITLLAIFYTAMACAGIVGVVQCVGLAAASIQFCSDIGGPIQLAQSAFNVITDVWILILPMPLVLKLQMPRARKIGLLAVFAVGSVACGASMTRLIEFAIRYHSKDNFWDHAIDSEVSFFTAKTTRILGIV
ncbi:hypothetical protein VPNG_05124 [Cytospora leucostoma]|uniref:Rhodopsin domain-containing protein n=1 Tax=Cytospora leucostoma TaxID=1230097 RepID=A0A423X4B5_9PEZI|nr:hypothetical protein VPNG_05124 [Cytospora leucostoma]